MMTNSTYACQLSPTHILDERDSLQISLLAQAFLDKLMSLQICGGKRPGRVSELRFLQNIGEPALFYHGEFLISLCKAELYENNYIFSHYHYRDYSL